MDFEHKKLFKIYLSHSFDALYDSFFIKFSLYSHYYTPQI